MKNNIVRSSRLVGSRVFNLENEKIGKIEDLVIDPVNRGIKYAVLSFGGFMGMGEDYFAILMEALQIDESNNDHVALNIDKDKLKNAPGFNKDNWPNHSDKQFLDSVYTHYGYEQHVTSY